MAVLFPLEWPVITALGLITQSTLSAESSSSFWLWAILATALLSLLSTKFKKPAKVEKVDTEKSLFPSIDRSSIYQEPSASHRVEASAENSPKPCSTGLTTRLLPFKNSKGEIEWVFTDDMQPGCELDAFKADVTPSSRMKLEHNAVALSPVTSNSSNNDSLSGKKNDSSSPQVNTPASTSSEDHKEEESDGQIHQCPHCEATFRMRGYLTRHLKKHSSEKAYRCPFHQSSIYKDENDQTHRCHPNGGFSRRDTYKTHLKSRHFRYPGGTSIKDRINSPGHCSMCGEWFQNAEIWSELHIEGAECKYLPPGFKGKSRIKNRLKKQMARLLKEQNKSMKKNNGSAPSTVEASSSTLATPNSMCTPVVPTASCYDMQDSPQSVNSSIGPRTIASSSFTDGYSKPFINPAYQPSMMPQPTILQEPQVPMDRPIEDYDDEFCLDTEQMSVQDFHSRALGHYPIYQPMGYPQNGHVSQFIH